MNIMNLLRMHGMWLYACMYASIMYACVQVWRIFLIPCARYVKEGVI